MIRFTVYTRHSEDCTQQKKGKYFKGCRCKKWLYESPSRKRHPTGTSSWERATSIAREREERANLKPSETDKKASPAGQLIIDRAKAYVAAMRTTGKSKDFSEKAERWLVERMAPVLASIGITHIHQIETSHIEDWRTTWKDLYGINSLFTKQKTTELISMFFSHCVRNKWISINPREGLMPVSPGDPDADFFTEEEYSQIEASVDHYARNQSELIRKRAQIRLLTFIRLLRWSGARITDAAVMAKKSLEGRNGKWTLRFKMIKTGTIAVVPIPATLAKQLQTVPGSNSAYFFWTGNGDPETASKDWWEKISIVFKGAALRDEDGPLKHCKPHMLRDTFAVLSLQAGVSLEDVQKALGHKSIKVTEKHYGHWSRSREEYMHDSFSKTWKAG